MDFDVREEREMEFFTGGSINMDYGRVFFTRSNGLKLKHLNDGFVYINIQLLASQDVNWWTGVLWIIVMFLSLMDSRSDGTHSLQRIHWCDVMLNFSKSTLIKKKLIYILPEGIFFFRLL